MDKNTILFESFNKAINDYFELHEAENEKKAEMLAQSGSQAEFTDYIAQTVSRVQSVAEVWENTPVAELGNITPKEYIDRLNDLDALMEAFKTGAAIVDVDLPYAFLQKLISFSDKAANALLELSCDKSLQDSENGTPAIPVAAVSALGMWKTGETVRPLIDLLRNTDAENELMFETISNTLVETGTAAIDAIADELEQSEAFGIVEEYLFSTLSKAGSVNKSDRIYKCLKNAFSKFDNKALGALFLADYGDGRAVPALRGYVEKNISNIDRDTFYDIKYAVEKLGGSMEDIKL